MCSALLNICSTVLNKNYLGANKIFQARRKNFQGDRKIYKRGISCIVVSSAWKALRSVATITGDAVLG